MTTRGDLVLGVRRFFAAVLPGAIGTALVWPELAPEIESRFAPFETESLVIAFAVLSYVVGQVAGAAGALLDGPYERYRERRQDGAYESRAERIAKAHRLDAKDPMDVSTLSWAEAELRLAHPEAAVAVDRLRADASFFRALSAVLGAAALGGFLAEEGAQLLISLGALPLIVTHYFRLRLDATQLVYRNYAVLNSIETRDGTVDIEVEPGAQPRE